MRVLALTNLYPTPLQPNRAPFNRQQLQALAGRHAVSVIAPISWTDELRRGRMSESRVGTRDGISVEHPRYVFPPKVMRGWYGHCFRRSVRPAFRRALDEFRPDVLLAAWAYPDGWAGVDLAREAGVRVVVKVHGSDVLLMSPGSARGRRTIEALGRADQVVTVSEDLRERVVRLGVDRARVSVVYNGVDTALFRPDGPKAVTGSDPLLLYVGNLAHVKGLDILVEACDRLHRAGVKFDCRMIGAGPMAGRLRRQIRACGLSERVRLMGPRAIEELPDWYRAASAFVLPSRSEGVPNVLLEAAACGTPIVATRVGGVAEIASGPGFELVPPEDAAALARAIERALSRGPVAGATFRPRSWEDSAAALAAVLERVN